MKYEREDSGGRYEQQTPLVRFAEGVDQYRGLFAVLLVLALWFAFPPHTGTRGPAIYPSLDVQRQVFFERATYGMIGAGILAVSVEERISSLSHISTQVVEQMGKTLALLHHIQRNRWGGVFLPSHGSYTDMLIKESVSRIDAWNRYWGGSSHSSNDEALFSRVKVWFRTWESALKELETLGYSLIHGDIALSNMGLSGNRAALLDVVRMRYGFAMEDTVAALDMLKRQFFKVSMSMEDAFWDGYHSIILPSEAEKAVLPFFEGIFHVKRLKRSLKHIRKGEVDWHQKVAWHVEALRRVVDKEVY
jgi:hypothetical protein